MVPRTWRSWPPCDATEVEVQDPAEAFTALDRAVVVGRWRARREQPVLEALMVPFEVVVLHVLGHDAAKMTLTER
jgi:hypothetical protein